MFCRMGRSCGQAVCWSCASCCPWRRWHCCSCLCICSELHGSAELLFAKRTNTKRASRSQRKADPPELPMQFDPVLPMNSPHALHHLLAPVSTSCSASRWFRAGNPSSAWTRPGTRHARQRQGAARSGTTATIPPLLNSFFKGKVMKSSDFQFPLRISQSLFHSKEPHQHVAVLQAASRTQHF